MIDRDDKAAARSELKRHLQSCKIYSSQHGQPCFLVSIAVKPGKNKPIRTKSVSGHFCLD